MTENELMNEFIDFITMRCTVCGKRLLTEDKFITIHKDGVCCHFCQDHVDEAISTFKWWREFVDIKEVDNYDKRPDTMGDNEQYKWFRPY